MAGLSARTPAGADTAGLIADLFSRKTLDAIHASLVCLPLVDHRWEAELKYGDSVVVGILNTVTATEVVVGAEGTGLDIATGAKKQILINKWYEAPIYIDEMTKLQTHINVMDRAATEGGYSIAKQIDTSIAALFAALNGATRLGTDGEAITDDVLLAAIETLDEANVPETGRALIINPSAKIDMLKITKFISKDYVREGAVANGKFGEIYGIPVFVTNNLANATTGAYACLLHKDAISIVAQQKPKTKIVEQPLKHWTCVLVDSLWGVLEMRNTFGVPIFTRSR